MMWPKYSTLHSDLVVYLDKEKIVCNKKKGKKYQHQCVLMKMLQQQTKLTDREEMENLKEGGNVILLFLSQTLTVTYAH